MADCAAGRVARSFGARWSLVIGGACGALGVGLWALLNLDRRDLKDPAWVPVTQGQLADDDEPLDLFGAPAAALSETTAISG